MNQIVKFLRCKHFKDLVRSSHTLTATQQHQYLSTKSSVAKFPLQNWQAAGTRIRGTQPRKYAASDGRLHVKRQRECWNCKAVTKPVEGSCEMICDKCQHLQDVNDDLTYFDLMGLPRNFNVEIPELTKKFRQLQSLVHPDKFSNKSQREQANSADWSSFINKAYKTLLIPIDRGQYLLQMQGEVMPQDNSALNKEFLVAMMERNEEVEDAETKEDLQRLNERIAHELHEKSQELSEKFETNSLEAAKSVLVEMKYLLSIQNSIRQKLEQLMGSL